MSDQNNVVELATELTIAWLSNPNTRAEQSQVPAFLESMHEAVTALESPASDSTAVRAVAPRSPGLRSTGISPGSSVSG